MPRQSGVAVAIDGRPARMRIANATLYRPLRNSRKTVKEPFLVGGGWGPRRFKGQIEDVRVYSRKLEPQELAALAVRATLGEIARNPAHDRTGNESFALRSAFLETDATEDVRAVAKSLTDMELGF